VPVISEDSDIEDVTLVGIQTLCYRCKFFAVGEPSETLDRDCLVACGYGSGRRV